MNRRTRIVKKTLKDQLVLNIPLNYHNHPACRFDSHSGDGNIDSLTFIHSSVFAVYTIYMRTQLNII